MAFATINKGASYFNTVTYAGAGGTQAVTGTGFKPDLVWIKNRSITADHMLYDVVRGTGATKPLTSDNTDPEGLGTNVGSPSQYGYLSAFGSDGFTVVAGSSNGNFVNTSGNNFVSWNWLAANSTTSNTSGTISSVVSVNTTSGFSIVSWTGDGSSSSTVGHGLGVKPGMIILKSRSFAATSYAWMVYQGSGAMNNNQNSVLNSTLAADGTSVTTQGQIYPPSVTSSVFGFAGGSGGVAAVNGSSATNIAYCFSAIKGFSKFGYYTGNGSTDGTFVYTGFKPAWLMVKRTDTADGWTIVDNKRNTYNLVTQRLKAEAADAESALDLIDFTSNGFKNRNSYVSWNASGGTYIYMAFAENPFVLTDGTPVTAR